MRKSLGAVGFACLFLLFLSGYVYPSLHKAVLAHNRKKISKKYHSSVTKPKAARRAALSSMKQERTSTAQKGLLASKVSRRSHKKNSAPQKKLTPTKEQATDQADDDEYLEYRVKCGDTLEELAEKFNIDKDEFRELNKTTGRLTPEKQFSYRKCRKSRKMRLRCWPAP